MSKPKLKCVHCKRHSASRPRGLCWVCFYNRDVRDLYPAKVTSFGSRSLRLGRRGQPTKYLPGTSEKIKVMSRRLARGETLFHPLDATFLSYASSERFLDSVAEMIESDSDY